MLAPDVYKLTLVNLEWDGYSQMSINRCMSIWNKNASTRCLQADACQSCDSSV